MGQSSEKAKCMVPESWGKGPYWIHSFPQPGTVVTLSGWWPPAKPVGPLALELLLGLIVSVPYLARPASPDSQKTAGGQPTSCGLWVWYGVGSPHLGGDAYQHGELFPLTQLGHSLTRELLPRWEPQASRMHFAKDEEF